jgi:hypothetical protein
MPIVRGFTTSKVCLVFPRRAGRLIDRHARCAKIGPKFYQIPIFRIFLDPDRKSPSYPPPSRPTQRGVAQRHETRGGMRWTRTARLTGAPDADGEVAWS